MHSLANLFEAENGANIELDSQGSIALDTLGYLPRFPAYLITAPVLQGLGTPAWQVMKRRANLAVAPVLVGRNPDADNETVVHGGAALRFLYRLTDTVQNLRDNHHNIEITLLGHSMGAILLNRLIALSGDELPITNIVYLAPASSLDDIQHLVLPYIYRQSKPRIVKTTVDGDDSATRLWVFTLNRRDEARETSRDYRTYTLLAPRGSLLAWIDQYFEPNNTSGQTVAGELKNIEAVATSSERKKLYEPTSEAVDFRQFQIKFPTIDDSQIRVFKVMRKIGEHNAPEEHGDFSLPEYLAKVLCIIDRRALRDIACNETKFDSVQR